MRCLKCGKEVGNAEKCIYCGGEVEKSPDKRFDTTIIESPDFLNNLNAAANPQMRPPQAAVPLPPNAPSIPPQQGQPLRRPVPVNQPQAQVPLPGQFNVPPQMQRPSNIPPQAPPVQQRPLQQPPMPRPQPFQEHPRPSTGSMPPVQPSSVRPIQPGGGQQMNIPQQGMPPARPVAPQQAPIRPVQPGMQPQMRPAQPVPARPIAPQGGQVNIPQPVNQPAQPRPLGQPVQPGMTPPAQQPQRITAQPVSPRPVPPQDGAIPAAQPMQIKPITPVPQTGTPGMQGARPPQPVPMGIHPPAAVPVPNTAIPQQPGQGRPIPPVGFPVAAQPPVFQQPQPQPARPVPVPDQGIPPQQPLRPAPVPLTPENLQPAGMENIGNQPVYESGIDIKPMDESMEVISSGDFFASEGNMFEPPSSGSSGDDGALPPAFARAQENDTGSPFGVDPATEFPGKGAVGQWNADEFQFAQEERKKGPYISEQKPHAGNEVTYKIISIALTIIGFFSLRIIDTLRIGVSNPYDKIFFVRLIIFAILFSFTGYLFFVKNLGKKEAFVKTFLIILVVLGAIGSFIGMDGITTSAESNFFVADSPMYYRLLDNPKGMAKYPAYSPSGNMAVMNYAPNNMIDNTIHLIKINLENEDKPAQFVERPATCSKQMYWYSSSEIIYPGLKISPTDPFKFMLLDANSGSISTLYTSYDYGLISDFDYSRVAKKITGSYANLIWTLDPESGELMPVTGLDMLARQYETLPTASDFTLNPAGFLSALKENRNLIPQVPYLDLHPRFSPDGKMIYFVRTDPAKPASSNICRVNIAELTATQNKSNLKTSADLMEYFMNSTEVLTTEPTFYGRIAVSPGSRFIASWVRARQGDNPNITKNENALVLFDTKEKTLIRIFPTYPTDAAIDQMDWSPDGKYIIADMNSGISSIVVIIEIPPVIVKMDQETL